VLVTCHTVDAFLEAYNLVGHSSSVDDAGDSARHPARRGCPVTAVWVTSVGMNAFVVVGLVMLLMGSPPLGSVPQGSFACVRERARGVAAGTARNPS
jgi:hypothetical protein